MNSFQWVPVETLNEKKESVPLFCKTGKNGFSLKGRGSCSMPRDFQQRFPFFSCFSDSTNELVVPDALALILMLGWRLIRKLHSSQVDAYWTTFLVANKVLPNSIKRISMDMSRVRMPVF